MLDKIKRLTLTLALAAGFGLGATLAVPPAPAEADPCPPFCDFNHTCPPGKVAATACGEPVCVKLCIY